MLKQLFISKGRSAECDSSNNSIHNDRKTIAGRGAFATVNDTSDSDRYSEGQNRCSDRADESLIVNFPPIPRRLLVSEEKNDFKTPKSGQVTEIVNASRYAVPSNLEQSQSKKFSLKEPSMQNQCKSTPKSPMRVSFSPHSTLHQWANYYHDEYSRYCSTWYNKSEYRKFHRTTKFEASLQRQRDAIAEEDDQGNDSDDAPKFGHINDSSPCSDIDVETAVSLRRGIEHLLCPKTLNQIMKCRELHKNTVLEQQFVVNSEQELRSVSKRVSKWGKARAWMYANVESGDIQRF
ncbi:hypothetical protein ACHAXS_011017 [Conticribra weissflogii]